MNQITLIPALLESYRTLKDRTFKIVFETNELTPSQAGYIHTNLQQFGFLAFKREFSETELKNIQDLKADIETGKSKAQRLRAVLYRLWEQEPKGYDVFDDFYNYHMEKLIAQIKTRLGP